MPTATYPLVYVEMQAYTFQCDFEKAVTCFVFHETLHTEQNVKL